MSTWVATPVRPRGNALRIALPVGLSVVAGAVLGWLHPTPAVALVAAIALACVVPLALRVAQRRFDLLEPIVVINVALLVMYVAQPAALLASGGPHVFKGYDIGPKFDAALGIALAGTLALQAGYALPWARRAAVRLPARLGGWDRHVTVVFACGLFVAGCAGFALFLHQAGGFGLLHSLLQGRSSNDDAYFRHSTAYLYGAPTLIWPASLLLFSIGIAQRRRVYSCLALVFMVPLAIFAGGQGQRIVLIPLLLAPAVLYLLARDRRPRPLVVVLVGYLVFTVGIAYFRDTRTAGEQISRVTELQRSLVNPGYEFDQLVTKGVDNDMFVSLASELEVVPSRLPVSPLDFGYRLLAKPIPSRLWRGKPVGPEEQLAHALYPSEHVRASSSSGIVGSFYLAGGAAGVIVGMALLGAVLRIPWEYWRRAPRSGATQLILTASLMFVPIALRGGLGDTLARTLFGLAPLVLAIAICSRRTVR